MASRIAWKRCSLFCAPCLSVRVPIGQTSTVQASLGSWESLLIFRMASMQTGRTRASRNSSRTLSKTDTTASQDTKKLIWEEYKRNHKGSIPPQRVRLRCKRNLRRPLTGNLCPICRNDIEISYKDVNLLSQFISPHTGKVLESSKTGVCRLQQKKLVEAIEKAADHGFLPYTIPEQHSEAPSITHPPWNKIHLDN